MVPSNYYASIKDQQLEPIMPRRILFEMETEVPAKAEDVDSASSGQGYDIMFALRRFEEKFFKTIEDVVDEHSLVGERSILFPKPTDESWTHSKEFTVMARHIEYILSDGKINAFLYQSEIRRSPNDKEGITNACFALGVPDTMIEYTVTNFMNGEFEQEPVYGTLVQMFRPQIITYKVGNVWIEGDRRLWGPGSSIAYGIAKDLRMLDEDFDLMTNQAYDDGTVFLMHGAKKTYEMRRDLRNRVLMPGRIAGENEVSIVTEVRNDYEVSETFAD